MLHLCSDSRLFKLDKSSDNPFEKESAAHQSTKAELENGIRGVTLSCIAKAALQRQQQQQIN